MLMTFSTVKKVEVGHLFGGLANLQRDYKWVFFALNEMTFLRSSSILIANIESVLNASNTLPLL